jgi:ribosome-binding protein aMBF1 (putative translation factor)
METHLWRDMLQKATSDPRKRQQLANELQVNPIVLLRWAAGEAIPPEVKLRQLLKALPNYEEGH